MSTGDPKVNTACEILDKLHAVRAADAAPLYKALRRFVSAKERMELHDAGRSSLSTGYVDACRDINKAARDFRRLWEELEVKSQSNNGAAF
jgi:hypothetical protein